MLRVTLDWRLVGSVTGVSTLHFSGTTEADADAAVAKIETAWTGAKEYFSSTASLQVNPEVFVIDPIDGETDSVLTVDVAARAAGTNVSAPVPQAAQVLAQIRTGVRRRNRQVQGRFYIPGLGVNVMGGGEVGTSTAALIAEELQALLGGSAGQLGVWHRPIEIAGVLLPGEFIDASELSVWSEFAILRGRRQ